MKQLTECGMIAVDQGAAIVDVNPTILGWLNSERADVLGRPLQAFLTLRMPLTGAAGMRPTDATLHGSSGVVRPVVVGSLGADAAAAHQQLAVFDVSSRSAFHLGFRSAEAKTERGRRRLQILLNSAVGFGNVRTEVDAADLLVDVAQRAFAASHVSVHLRRPEGVVQAAGVNPLEAFWPQGYRPTGSTTLLSGGVVVIRRPEDADAYTPGVSMSDVFRSSGITAAIASPMQSHGDSVGSMVCYFDHPREF
ncbi:MAG TPA: GAF domain-containing protein, partial [Naasia sp.]